MDWRGGAADDGLRLRRNGAWRFFLRGEPVGGRFARRQAALPPAAHERSCPRRQGSYVVGQLEPSAHQFSFWVFGAWVGKLGWGRLKRWSAGRARWRPSEGQGFQELGPRGEHNIGAQGLQVVEEACSGSKRLAGVPPSA